MQRAVELQVGGQRYRVVSSASPEDLERLARVVDDKIAALVPPGKPITPQALLLAAMALANDLDEERARHASLQREAGQSLSRILGQVDDAIASIDAQGGVAPSAGSSVAPSAGSSVAPSAGSSVAPSAGSSVAPATGPSAPPSAGTGAVAPSRHEPLRSLEMRRGASHPRDD